MMTQTAYIQKMEAQIDEWNDEIAQLRSQVTHPAFQRHLDALSANVQAVHQKLHELKQTPQDDWDVVRVDVEDGVVILHQNFDRTRKEFREGAYGWDPEKAGTREVDSEGWVEGMGHREHDSEGWVEGMGHQEHDSEGWVEGMGHQEHDSEGWPEGTDKRE
jgi:hypothetical protein